jgi:hypothetical protein
MPDWDFRLMEAGAKAAFSSTAAAILFEAIFEIFVTPLYARSGAVACKGTGCPSVGAHTAIRLCNDNLSVFDPCAAGVRFREACAANQQ